MMTCKIASLLAIIGTLLATCAPPVPATVNGLESVFHDPGFIVQGKTRQDQEWISETQETGIRVLGWARPKGVAKQKVVLAKTRRSVPVVAKPVTLQPKGHILLPVPRVESPTNEGESDVSSPAPEVVPAQPVRKKSINERLQDEIRALNEKVKKLEGR
jgi:hypothetical protein